MFIDNPFPNDKDMLRAFTKTARDTFVGACDRELGEEIDPACIGKPLHFFNLVVKCGYRPSDNGLMPSYRLEENLGIEILDSDRMKEVLKDSDLTSDEKNNHHQAAEDLGAVALTSTFDAGLYVSTKVVAASYRVRRSGEPSEQSVSTFKAGDGVPEALFFAREALAYVQSSEFYKSVERRRRGNVSEYYPGETVVGMQHEFHFALSPDLPLTGDEPVGFLERYRSEMMKQYVNAWNNLDKMLRSKEPLDTDTVETQREIASKYQAALARAATLLR